MHTGPATPSPPHTPATLATLLREQAHRRGDAPALLALGRSALSYAGLHTQTGRLAAHLKALGATSSTRVAVLLPPGPEMAAAFLGVASGAVCAPLNPAYTAAELRFHLHDLRAQTVVLLRSATGPIRDVALELGLTLVEIEPDEAAAAGCFRIVDELRRSAAAEAPASAPDDVALLLHTSGTTARPKRVPLSQGNLMASAHHIAAHLGLSPGDRCLNVMPLFHIHGLVGALLATLAGGGSVVCTPGFDDVAFFDWIATFEPSWYTAVPTIHQAVLARGAAYRTAAPQHRFRFVRSSSAALPAATLRGLQALLQAPVVEAYSMTEASHQMASNPVQAGAQTPGSVGSASGVEIAILDPAGRHLAHGEPGEIVVRGPGVMRGYDGDGSGDGSGDGGGDTPAHTDAFHDGWFRTGDLGQLDAQGRLFIAGRLKDIVNRGGEKISPQEVDDALLEHPDLLQAAAFGVPHPTLGEDLAAAVVRRAGTGVDEAALREFLFERLAAFKVPSQIVFVHRLPTGATGKLQRAGLHRALAGSLTRAFVAPGTEAQVAVAAIFADVLACGAVGSHDNFFARGGDSLKGARVVARVNSRFGTELPVTALFRHPSVVELVAQIETPDGDRPGGAVVQTTLAPRTTADEAPCAFSQEALWVVEQLVGGGVYNNAQAVRIGGPLNVAALDQALQALVARHESLRTGIEESNGGLLQRIHASVSVPLVHVDAGEFGAPEQHAALQQRLVDAAAQPLDLAQAPLVHASLWRLAPRDHVLLLVVHHVVTDGWSTQVLARDLSALYSAFSEGQKPVLPALSIQFADWAKWQRERLQGERLDADLRFWRAQVAGLEPLALPTDRPHPPLPSHAGRDHHFSVPAALVAPLRALAREHDVTLFMLLLAAFKVLLMRHAQQTDVAVGSPVAGRDRPELEGLVGYFANTVVLRTDLGGDPRFSELLARVRQTALDAFTHQALPFDQLVAELSRRTEAPMQLRRVGGSSSGRRCPIASGLRSGLSPQRDPGRNPLVQLCFALNNQPAPAYEMNGVEARPWPLPTAFAKFDLSLSFVEAGDELHGVVEYSTDLFEASTVGRLGSHLLNLLAGIAADPGSRLARLPLLGDAERRMILHTWNDTARPYPLHVGVHTLIEQQVQLTPLSTAAVLGSQRLDYRELNARANRLAHHLRRLGVGPEVLVGVCMERSLELVVALLAVLKAGGAFVPLDPELPGERLGWILYDTAAPVVLTQTHLVPRLPPQRDGAARQLLRLDTLLAQLPVADEHDPVCLSQPDHLAYVVHTSGSTGKPKGVMVPHRALTNHELWLRDTMGTSRDDRVLQMTTISFDAAVSDFFMPLLSGATVVLPQPGDHRDTGCLVRVMRDERITIVEMVPSMLRLLLDEPGLEACVHLRQVRCGGEALGLDLAEVFRRRLPNATLGNFYGPSETTNDATHRVARAPYGTAATVPIGRPIANAQCFVLDALLQPVPVGVTGELCIGGTGLARGYLNRPDLTEERFVPHPFAPGQRLYRTGDQVHWLPDGQIEYLGRTDFQVKIRGIRIELGEIEAALNVLPGVQQGVVLAREDQPGHKRLVAYVVARGGGVAPDPAELRRGLQRQLAEALVPSAFVLLPRLPTLPNGKLDRNALPAPELPVGQAESVAPRTPMEQAAWDIWCEVLHLPQFSVHDNFFELGGHSLLAMQVIARLRSTLQIELALRTMFEHPTLEALASQIDRTLAGSRVGGGSHDAIAASTTIAKVGRDGPLVVSYSQRRMWLVQTLNPRTTAYNVCLGLRLLGPLNGEALAQAIDVVVQRHEAFRTRFGAVNGEVVQWIDPPSPALVERIDLRHLPAEQREREALAQREQLAARRFDLSASGLYRICVLQMGEAEHVLLWFIHHVIGDHWSDGILLREVGQAYDALQRGLPPALPALPIEYADYAAWQRADAHRERLAPQMAYWTARLQDLQPLPLPHDLAWRELPSGRGGSVTAQLPASTLAALKQRCSRHGITPFMAMLACFKLVLSRYSGQTDIAVGTPVANRTRVEAEHLVGTLVNTLVMRTDLAGNPTWAELLARVRETALEAFEHQDAPFERLVEELHVDRSSHRQPLVQVLFNVINAPFDLNALPGLSLQPFAYTSIAAQFELGLTVDDAFGEVHITYSTDLFVRTTAARVLASFLAVVEQLIAANPEEPALDVDVMGATARAELLQWNATDVAVEPGLRLGDLIRRQVQRSGEASAVVCEGRCLSYTQLDARARTLARHLRTLGAGPGVLVGVCLERCPELVWVLLGVIYSGAAYVPLDPAYPPERLARMAEDADMRLVLSRPAEWQRLAPALPASLQPIDIDAPMSPPGDVLCDAFELTGTARDPAYVIYTSGSTGRPKGVVVPHGAVVNFLASMAREPGLQASDVLVAVTTLSFDIAVLELLLPLSVGATVVLARRDEATDGRALRALLENHRATVMQATPSTWRMLIDAGWSGHDGFKALIGGEGLPPDLAQQLLVRTGPHGALWNLYGPTETTVWSTCWKVASPEQGIRIGGPIGNTQIHVLDARGQPCPIGVAGELFIGGAGVALGYLNRPELSAERFVPDPFSALPGARMYRTGDRGRWCHDGLLEHLGRLDFQVKVRGHRIELGEIEAALGSHAQVARAVVIVREDRPGDLRLVAYIVAQGEVPTAAALREHLRGSLPDYMLPQHVVTMAALPLLPNGKMDRHALPAPDRSADAATERPLAANELPQSDAEQAVAAVWHDLLGTGPIARSDNFFDLGGHSLLAMRAVGEMERHAGIRIELRRLVHESLAQIAATPAQVAAPDAALAAESPARAAAPPATPPAAPGSLKRMIRSVRDLIGS